MTNKTSKTLMTIFYIVIVLAVGLLLFAFIGAEVGFKPAQDIMSYIQDKLDIMVSGTAITALLAGVRFLSSIKTKNESSLLSLEDLKDKVIGANGELTKTEKALSKTISNLDEKFQKLDTVATEVTSLKDYIKGKEDREKTVIDLLLVYVFKNSSDQTLNEIRLAYQESELLKNVRALQDIEKEDIPIKTKKELPQVMTATKDTLRQAKQRIRL